MKSADTHTHFRSPFCPPNEEGEQTNTVKEALNTPGTISSRTVGPLCRPRAWVSLSHNCLLCDGLASGYDRKQKAFLKTEKTLCVCVGRDMRTEGFVSMPHNKDLILIR